MIKQDSNKFVEVNEYGDKERAWRVHCDECGHTSRHHGADAGDAADLARKEGFQAVYPGYAKPAQWICKGCMKKKMATVSQ